MSSASHFCHFCDSGKHTRPNTVSAAWSNGDEHHFPPRYITLCYCKHMFSMNRGPGAVTPEERHELLGQRGLTIWLTGLSASGKVSR
jgi:hypothetical protein